MEDIMSYLAHFAREFDEGQIDKKTLCAKIKKNVQGSRTLDLVEEAFSFAIHGAERVNRYLYNNPGRIAGVNYSHTKTEEESYNFFKKKVKKIKRPKSN